MQHAHAGLRRDRVAVHLGERPRVVVEDAHRHREQDADVQRGRAPRSHGRAAAAAALQTINQHCRRSSMQVQQQQMGEYGGGGFMDEGMLAEMLGQMGGDSEGIMEMLSQMGMGMGGLEEMMGGGGFGYGGEGYGDMAGYGEEEAGVTIAALAIAAAIARARVRAGGRTTQLAP